MDHRDPGSARYSGVPAAIVTRGMEPLGFFLASDSSDPVRIEHGGGIAAWILGTLGVPSVRGHQLPWLLIIRAMVLSEPFSSLRQLAIRGSLWLLLLLLGLFEHL